eukprot:scaffold29738_cov129-Isochrysis_galbana.AAC.1
MAVQPPSSAPTEPLVVSPANALALGPTTTSVWKGDLGSKAMNTLGVLIIWVGKSIFGLAWSTCPLTRAPRAAPSASAPNDTVMDNLESSKRPREASQGNMVSQRATQTASVLPESQSTYC